MLRPMYGPMLAYVGPMLRSILEAYVGHHVGAYVPPLLLAGALRSRNVD